MKTFFKEEILERLKIAVNVSSDSELANALGVSKSTISNWKNRKSIDYDLVFSFCEHINLDWLLTGRGEMLKSKRTFPENTAPCINSGVGNTISKDSDNNPIPQANSNFSADTLLRLITDKDDTIRSMAEEIGRLKERIALLECRLQKDASSADTHLTANVG